MHPIGIGILITLMVCVGAMLTVLGLYEYRQRQQLKQETAERLEKLREGKL